MDICMGFVILPSAFILDLLFGDPQTKIHPIRWMGHAIAGLESRFRKLSGNLILSGLIFSLCLIAGSWLTAKVLIILAGAMHPVFGVVFEIILIYYCISATALCKEGQRVGDTLKESGLDEAKKKLSLIVGRDVENFDEEGVVRATVETVSENLVDGVISPLFYAAIGGAPLAIAYKMVNTLDSMIGYKNEKYVEFGKAAAKIDDAANYIPARLSAVIISLIAQIFMKRGTRAFITAIREGKNHASPNAGYSEAAFAGTLGVKLGGPNYYHGKLVEKPYIGKKFGPVNIRDIEKACYLTMLSSILWFMLIWGIEIVIYL